MSDLLQQAMIDATALKEAAIKNAQNALIEKYSQEFNNTVQKLLEQEEVVPPTSQPNATPPVNPVSDSTPESDTSMSDLSSASVDPMADNFGSMDLQADKKNAFSKVPGSFSDEDNQMVTINFDQIRATLNEMLGERYESASREYISGDAQDKGGNPTMKVTVKGSKNAVTEKWHEEELEEMTASDNQNEGEGGELEEMELMDEEDPKASPTGTPSTPPAQSSQEKSAGAAQLAQNKEASILASFIKKNPDKSQQLVKDMRDAKVLTTVPEKIAAFGSALGKASPLIAAGGAGSLAIKALTGLAVKMASEPQFLQSLLSSVGINEQELEETSATATQEAEGYERLARAKRGEAAAAGKEEKGQSRASTMEEEIELTEEELQELAEELRVDLKVGNLSDGYMGSTETQKREQRTVELAAARDSKAAEEREAELEKMKDLMQENKKLKVLNSDTTKSLSALKEHLEKVNLSNAKLLYTNKALGSISLNERQKNQIVESISKAGSVLEAKTIYETLQNAVENSEAKKEAPQSLREALNKAPSPFAVKKTPANSLNDVMAERMKALAGIKK